MAIGGASGSPPPQLPGGGVLLSAGRVRRDGPSDASSVVIVVEPPDTGEAVPDDQESADGERPAAHLDRRAFLATQAPSAPRTRQQRPTATIGCGTHELPFDEPRSMRDLVRDVYLVHGWATVLDVEGQLAQMHDIKLHPGAGPPSDQDARARFLALQQQAASVNLETSRQWLQSHRDARADVGLRVLHIARRLEQEARETAKEMLRQSRERVIDETLECFRWSTRRSARAALEAGFKDPPQFDPAVISNIKARIQRLSPLAEAALATAADVEAERDAVEHPGAARLANLSPRFGGDRAARIEAADVAATAFGAALIDEASDRPVLFRLDLETLVDAAKMNDKELVGLLFDRLKNTWVAAGRARREIDKAGPAGQADDDRVRRGAVPEQMIAAEADESVWKYRRVVEAASAQMRVEDADFAEQIIGNVDAARTSGQASEALRGVVIGLGTGALTLALTVVCPPAGLALDLGLSLADVVAAINDYQSQSDAALSDLDPRRSLADASPSAVPLVVSVAGAVLTAVVR